MKIFQPDARLLLYGQGLMVLCSVFYLIWWGAAFRPGRHGTTFASGSALCVAALCGIVGVVLSIWGMQDIPKIRPSLSGAVYLAAGVAVYLVLLAVTSAVCKRQVTTELLLIVGWAALELSVLSAVYGGEIMELRMALIWSVTVLVAAVISLVCYLLYYRLTDKAGYVDGMIPLILAGLVAAGIDLCLMRRL